MADEASKTPGPFDIVTIRSLVGLMQRHGLSEIDLREGDQRIRLLRGGPAPANPPAPAAAALPAPAVMPAPDHVKPAKPAAPSRNLTEIKSQSVGTFYSKPNPDAEPYVRVGSRVTPTTVIGLIEAMKLFNEVTAECSGVVEEILVENQQAVDFGQVLFRVNPSG